MKTIEENIIFENKFITICNNKILDFNGNECTHIMFGKLNRKGKEGVIVLPVNDKGQIFAFEEYRYAYQGYILNLPSGECEDGLTIEENALKELREESNLTTNNLERVNLKTIVAPSTKKAYVNHFIAYDCVLSDKVTACDATESFRGGQWFDIEEIYENIMSGKMDVTMTALPILFHYYIETMKKGIK